MFPNVKHSTCLLQFQNLRVKFSARRFITGQNTDAARKEHADKRRVAHANAEHSDSFIGKGIKILINKMIHIQKPLLSFPVSVLSAGKEMAIHLTFSCK